MLKRQRSTPSFVPDAYAPMDLAIDAFEDRVAKRRRQFASPHSYSTDKGKAPWRPEDSDGEEDVENEGHGNRRLAPSEQAQRLQQAGEYKHVNTLLHDLHAEQRHRMLFSSVSPPEHIPIAHNHPPNHPQLDYPCPSFDKLAPTVPAYGPLPAPPHESDKHMASFTISIPSRNASGMDHVEVQRVTERYEDTNRFLGSLFLSRRRQGVYPPDQSQV